jgi:hypothetical protein
MPASGFAPSSEALLPHADRLSTAAAARVHIEGLKIALRMSLSPENVKKRAESRGKPGGGATGGAQVASAVGFVHAAHPW